ncbi:Importin subunit beta-3 [Vitis vinifera]|uniref:Importin subunit beta-3 n=1 Tax=Vitis vinifera TaxID=29760 RepID=A0A438C4A3_VITVI|nr:Importin subunit beta-3 [Vitis vinifera]
MFQCLTFDSTKLQEAVFLIFAQLAQYIEETLVSHIKHPHSMFLQSLTSSLSSNVKIAALSDAINFIQCLSSSTDRDRFQDLLPAMMRTITEALNCGQKATTKEALKLQRLRPGGGDATFGGGVRDSSGRGEGARTWDDEEVVVVSKAFAGIFGCAGVAKNHATLIAVAQIAKVCSKVMIKNLEQMVTMVLNTFPNPHPRVRWAAINAIGQLSTDMGPDLQVQYHQRVLPALAASMDDFQNPQV